MNTQDLPQPTASRTPRTRRFMRAGMGLMLGVITLALARAGDEPIPQPEPVRSPLVSRATVKPQERYSSLSMLHAVHFDEFQSAPGFGLRRVMVMPSASELILGEFTYVVPKPDLIALEDESVAYRSPGEMISMSALTNFAARFRLAKRELSSAELRAIKQLRNGEEIVLQPALFQFPALNGTNTVAGQLAVGALRAGTACARCHGCDEGTLLGAFSYALIPKAGPVPGQHLALDSQELVGHPAR